MKIRTLPVLAFLVVSLPAISHSIEPENVISFDRYVISPEELFYDEDTELTPDRAFVVLRSFRPMSAPSGERFALVTVQNQLNSRQTMKQEDFVGVFADGSKAYPQKIDIKIDSGRTFSFILAFGENRFPLVKLVIDNGKN